jgi:RNA polymerase sigma-70 factor (ECF subfamily)
MGDVSNEEFSAFCEDVHPRLVGALSLYCGELGVAEELAQEALAIAFRDWSKVRRMDDRAGWAFRVGFNLCNSYFRRRAAERRANARLQMSTNLAPAITEPEEAVAVRQSVARLPRRQRAAVVLRFLADYSVAETARVMDCPEATVKTLTRRGLATLRLQDDIKELREVRDVT